MRIGCLNRIGGPSLCTAAVHFFQYSVGFRADLTKYEGNSQLGEFESMILDTVSKTCSSRRLFCLELFWGACSGKENL